MSAKAKLSYFDKIMMAITFAEADDARTARSILMNENKTIVRPEHRASRRPSLEL